MAKEKVKEEKQEEVPVEMDGSTLPPFFSGSEDAKPIKADLQRTTYFATDTRNRYMYIGDKWVFIEKL